VNQKTMLLVLLSGILITTTQAAEKKKISVKVEEAKRESVADILQYPAQIQAKERSVVMSEIQGNLLEITVSLGQSVKVGDTVAIVQNTMPGYEFSKAKLISPIEGIVSEFYAPVGSRLTQNTKILEIFNPKKLHALIDIPAKELGSLKGENTGRFTNRELEIDAQIKIIGVSPYIHPITGTATAEIEFLDNTEKLQPGLLGSAIFRVKERDTFLIPETAITYLGNKPKIGIISEGKYQLRDIKLGSRRAGKIEVTEGITEKETIVVRASGFVAEGEEVLLEGQQDKAAGAKL
jgi:multidrug efflux pump subunit AcrA (membrane-fusion protein)